MTVFLNACWMYIGSKNVKKYLLSSFTTFLSQESARKFRSAFALLCKLLTREIALSIDLRVQPTIFSCDEKYALVFWFWWDKTIRSHFSSAITYVYFALLAQYQEILHALRKRLFSCKLVSFPWGFWSEFFAVCVLINHASNWNLVVEQGDSGGKCA